MDITLPTNVIVSGSTRSGKTYRVREMLESNLMRQADYVIVFAPTAEYSGDWGETKNDDPKEGKVYMVFSTVEDFKPALQEIVDQQQKLVRRHGADMKSKILPQVLVILDDCLGLSILRLRGPIDKLSTRSRHLHISLFVLVQKITAVPRTMRLNSEYLILFNMTNFSELERFLQEYVPKRMQKSFAAHIEDIFNTPFAFIVCHNYATQVMNRLYKGDPTTGTVEPLLPLLQDG